MTPRRLSKFLYPVEDSPAPVEAARYARFVEQVWFEYQAGRVGRVISQLPALIKNAQRLEEEPDNSRGAWAVSARIHHLATTTLCKVGEADLAWICAERSMSAAEQSGDPPFPELVLISFRAATCPKAQV
jgi:hypothetical protein